MRNILALSLLAVIFLAACGKAPENENNQSSTEVPVKINYNEYHLLVDSLAEYAGTIKRNQTLSDILLPLDVTPQEVYYIADKSRPVFDIKNIKYGNNYRIYFTDDSVKSMRYLVYEEDPINFVVFDLEDSLNVYKGQKEVKVREKETAGIIDYSLYATLQEQDADINLALKLSEIFAWQIDFWSIRKGDSFRIIYNERYIDDEPVGIGRIKAAVFNHRGEDYYAIYFEDGEKADYYDEEGHSLRKAFLKAPLKFSRISSRYSHSRLHPILKRRRPHLGIDYAAPTGTPVRAVGDGVVIHRKYSGGAGNYIKVKHNGTYTSGYMHLSKYASGINVGSKVRQGQVIGYVGSTGLSTGPHLDFRFYINGKAVNYLNVEFPPSTPVKESLRHKYDSLKNNLVERLLEIHPEERTKIVRDHEENRNVNS